MLNNQLLSEKSHYCYIHKIEFFFKKKLPQTGTPLKLGNWALLVVVALVLDKAVELAEPVGAVADWLVSVAADDDDDDDDDGDDVIPEEDSPCDHTKGMKNWRMRNKGRFMIVATG